MPGEIEGQEMLQGMLDAVFPGNEKNAQADNTVDDVVDEPTDDANADSGDDVVADSETTDDKLEDKDPFDQQRKPKKKKQKSPEEIEISKERSLSLLRKKAQSEKNRREELETKYRELEEKFNGTQETLNSYDGRVFDEEKITKWKKLESIFDVQGTQEYQEKFIQGEQAIKDKVVAIIKGYGESEGLDEVYENLKKTDRSQIQNAFEKAGFNSFDQQKVYELLNQSKTLDTERVEFENASGEARENLIQDLHERKKEARQQSFEQIRNESERAFKYTIDTYTKGDHKIEEFIKIDGDLEQNKKVDTMRKDILNDYNALVDSLYDNGLSSLPQAAARRLARSAQLSRVLPPIKWERDSLRDELREAKAEIAELTGMANPEHSDSDGYDTNNSKDKGSKMYNDPASWAKDMLASKYSE